LKRGSEKLLLGFAAFDHGSSPKEVFFGPRKFAVRRAQRTFLKKGVFPLFEKPVNRSSFKKERNPAFPRKASENTYLGLEFLSKAAVQKKCFLSTFF